MRRLARTVGAVADEPMSDVVTHTMRTLRDDGAEDDVAVLAFRWTPDNDIALSEASTPKI